jgi:hypothetical protein
MKRGTQLALIFGLSGMICSVASHSAVRLLGIKVSWGRYKECGPQGDKTVAILHSSSPGYDGVDWNRVAEGLGGVIGSWATAGSTPSEWEVMASPPSNGAHTFVAVSAHELNEYQLCDFRAEIVPLTRTIADLRVSRPGWHFGKRLLAQYPMMWLRKLFPTSGRSDGVMVGLRALVQRLAGKSPDAAEMPKFGVFGESEIKVRLSDWSQARRERRLELLRSACLGKQSYNGPKRLALLRLIQQAQTQGEVVLVVVPEPPLYREALLPPRAIAQMEEELTELQTRCRSLHIIRLDAQAALDRNELYYDYLHLNKYGREIATEALLRGLKANGILRESKSSRPMSRVSDSRRANAGDELLALIIKRDETIE